MTVVAALVPVDIYLGLVRSLFTALSLWMAYRIARQHFARRGPLDREVSPDAAP
jgi:hypothetical protein